MTVLGYLAALSSILTVTGVGAVAYGYRMSLRSPDPATRYFSRSLALLAAAIFMRRLAWDILAPLLLGHDYQQPVANLALNVVVLVAVYWGLRARYYLIPWDERGGWRWWNAWLHPCRCTLRR